MIISSAKTVPYCLNRKKRNEEKGQERDFHLYLDKDLGKRERERSIVPLKLERCRGKWSFIFVLPFFSLLFLFFPSLSFPFDLAFQANCKCTWKLFSNRTKHFQLFLTKLLTEDLPRLFVRPKKIVLDFQKGKAVGPVPEVFKSGDVQEKNKDSVGELSVTLVDARNLSYVLYGKTDPYVVLCLGDQRIRSKKNSQTTVIGPPGEPIWNQDFHMLVADPQNQKMYVEVVDSLGFADLAMGSGEVDLSTLQDTVPTDKIVVLTSGWNLLRKRNCGELLLRLTYKAYVEDEEEEGAKAQVAGSEISEDDASDADEPDLPYKQMLEGSVEDKDKESFMDVLTALIVSEEFLGIVTSETGNPKVGNDVPTTVTTTPKPPSLAANSMSSEVDGNAESSKGSALFWLAVLTGVAVVIALNVGGSSVFNP